MNSSASCRRSREVRPCANLGVKNNSWLVAKWRLSHSDRRQGHDGDDALLCRQLRALPVRLTMCDRNPLISNQEVGAGDPNVRQLEPAGRVAATGGGAAAGGVEFPGARAQ